jgi:OmcA/MtrC family decaheme c-type cytochrome
MQRKRTGWAGTLALIALVGCDDCDGHSGSSCSVAQLDGGVSITCTDGSEATIPDPPPAEPCSVEQSDDAVTLSCPDGTSVTVPVAADAGDQSCTVAVNPDGTSTISCPDGTSAIIPAAPSDAGPDADTGTLALVHYRAATTTACGACHDSEQNNVHYTTMTTWVDGKPVEDCATCHKESGIKPVSAVHARPEFGPPGFQVQILDAGIDPTTRLASVNLRIQDTAGNPLDRTGVSTSFLIARVPSETPVGGTTPVAGPYNSYLNRSVTQLDNPDFPLQGAPRVVQQPTTDGAGTYANTGPGLYTYTFASALPADYDVNLTHVISHYSTRTVGEVRWVSNSAHHFVPANPAATPLRRQVVQTATCNGCHNPLSAHGGSREEIQVCLGCHSQDAVDPESNNSIDLNVMIHRIHMGADLPSVKAGKKYAIVGRNNTTDDFSTVHYPRDIVHCQSCHTDADGDRWVTNGKPEVCTSCHDNINEPGVHPFALASNAVCGNGACHGPSGSAPDAREAHSTFLNMDAAPVFDISIVSATVANADAAPALRVKALTGTRLTGAVVPVAGIDNLSTLNVFLNGPNGDFVLNGHDIKQYGKASLVGLAATSTPGEFTFSLPETLRAATATFADVSKDSFTLGIRAAYDPTPNASPDNDRVDMLKNPTVAISAAGAPVVRDAVVDNAKCNACHGDLREHGGDILARNVEECIMCHTKTLETSPRQGANKEPGPTVSLRFSQLVHRIHGSQVATAPYFVYGYASMAPYPKVDFTSVRFPGDAKDCRSCHLDGTYFVPLLGSPTPTETLVLDDAGAPIKR